MSKMSNMEGMDLQNMAGVPSTQDITPFDLRLVTKKISIKFSEYKISTQMKNMFHSETIAISKKGILFTNKCSYEKGTLMRIWIELPDYWSKKSKHVDYRHTDAPNHFQVLSRVISCEEKINQTNIFQILCENLNIDPIDESVLQDYLVTTAGAQKK